MIEALTPYYEAAELESQQAMVDLPLGKLEWIICELPEPKITFANALAVKGLSVIAEHKRKSPSQGDIRPGSDVTTVVKMYEEGGAAAISILTQGKHFGGRVEDLTEANFATELPILRKDFIRSEYQLYQAKALGADAVLLIAAGLTKPELKNLCEEAEAIDLDCLVEVHDEKDLEIALEIKPKIVGINNRNLVTLEEDIDTTRQLISEIPQDIIRVAESGYSTRRPEHYKELCILGVNAVLMGTSLMKEDNPAEVLKDWLATV
ncbi:MAG TPA: indole-3-glycerol phosphate synthase TrpC [Patescibacteria group bacterium]|nr:indole-3-glycerol phosphate synthase TrpC [Patescibacteria group bacterium]